jgi:DNA repair protein SbcD/Mre11
MVKIVHTADLHIGLESHGPVNPHTGLPRRLEDFLEALDRIVDAAIDKRADLVVLAGDIYKSRDPNPTHQQQFARRLVRLIQAKVPVFILAGNHDLPNAVSRASSIDIFRELEVIGVTVARAPGVRTVETPSGSVVVAALPWIPRSLMLSQVGSPSTSASDFDQAFVDWIEGQVDELAAGATQARDQAGPSTPVLLVAHVHAREARDGAERLLTVGNDPLIPVTRLAIEPFDYVALGHIHAHQELSKKPPAVYPGSIERVNFGEEREEKGFVVADVQAGACTWRFVPLPTRRFVTVDVKALSDDPTEATLKLIARKGGDIENAVVRVRVQVSPQNQALFDEGRIRAALEGAFWIHQVVREVDRPARTRIAGLSVEGKTPLELLDDYFTEKQIPQDERIRLRSYAERLVEQEALS